MEQALNGQDGPAPSVRMLPTYVGSTPHGTGGWHRLGVAARHGECAVICGKGASLPLSILSRPHFLDTLDLGAFLAGMRLWC